MCCVFGSWTMLLRSTKDASSSGEVPLPVVRHASDSMARCATRCDSSSATWYETKPLNIGRTCSPVGSCGLGIEGGCRRAPRRGRADPSPSTRRRRPRRGPRAPGSPPTAVDRAGVRWRRSRVASTAAASTVRSFTGSPSGMASSLDTSPQRPREYTPCRNPGNPPSPVGPYSGPKALPIPCRRYRPPVPDADPQDLVARARGGDRAAMDALVATLRALRAGRAPRSPRRRRPRPRRHGRPLPVHDDRGARRPARRRRALGRQDAERARGRQVGRDRTRARRPADDLVASVAAGGARTQHRRCARSGSDANPSPSPRIAGVRALPKVEDVPRFRARMDTVPPSRSSSALAAGDTTILTARTLRETASEARCPPAIPTGARDRRAVARPAVA